MAKDSIELIREAERQAQEAVNTASARAEAIIAEAKKRAAEQYSEMVAAAKQAAQEALEASREEGRRITENDTGKYEAQCQAVRNAAEKKRDAAVRLVIECITG